MTKEITTAEQALELLEKVVEEKGGDYVYQPRDGDVCRYVENDQPACIVGHALFRAGYSIEEIKPLDSVHAAYGSPVGSIDASGIPEVLPGVSPDAAEVFGLAQERQDSGGTWGHALAIARAGEWYR